jgi:hypothetical protein
VARLLAWLPHLCLPGEVERTYKPWNSKNLKINVWLYFWLFLSCIQASKCFCKECMGI